MDLATRRKYYQACSDEPLEPADPRNVDIDKLPGRPRGISWIERFAGDIELSPKPVQTFLTGLPGSGKSTELRRLSERLSDPNAANLLVVSVDADKTLDLLSPIDVPDLFMVIIKAAEEEVLRAEGGSADEALAEGYLERLWNWLAKTDVELKGLEVAKLTVEMKNQPGLRERIRQTIATHFTTFLGEARDELILLEERARKCGRSGIVVILDSLEKLRGISTNFELVLQSAERVFGGGAPHLRLPVHALFTIPAALTTRQAVDVEFLPVIKLRNHDGSSAQSGVDAMRELIRRRLPDEALIEILGNDFESRLEAIIGHTGGYPRELIKMLIQLIKLPKPPATDDDLERAQNDVRERFRAVVMSDDFDWLARVAREKTLTVKNDQHRPIVVRALSNNVVLRYCNKDAWYDLHPAVRVIPGVEAAIKRDKTATKTDEP